MSHRDLGSATHALDRPLVPEEIQTDSLSSSIATIGRLQSRGHLRPISAALSCRKLTPAKTYRALPVQEDVLCIDFIYRPRH